MCIGGYVFMVLAIIMFLFFMLALWACDKKWNVHMKPTLPDDPEGIIKYCMAVSQERRHWYKTQLKNAASLIDLAMQHIPPELRPAYQSFLEIVKTPPKE